jgi:hypothetical protein
MDADTIMKAVRTELQPPSQIQGFCVIQSWNWFQLFPTHFCLPAGFHSRYCLPTAILPNFVFPLLMRIPTLLSFVVGFAISGPSVRRILPCAAIERFHCYRR